MTAFQPLRNFLHAAKISMQEVTEMIASFARPLARRAAPDETGAREPRDSGLTLLSRQAANTMVSGIRCKRDGRDSGSLILGVGTDILGTVAVCPGWWRRHGASLTRWLEQIAGHVLEEAARRR
jgi:hypothetical protein